MNITFTLRLACATATLFTALTAHADSFASSASSAGSASSGSVSGSLKGSSNSSTGGNKQAAVDYRIVDIAIVAAGAGRPGLARLTLQAQGPQEPQSQQQQQQQPPQPPQPRLVLELPQAIAQQQRLAPGDVVQARPRVYGFEFARGDSRDAFFLVLADDWYGDLAARPLSL